MNKLASLLVAAALISPAFAQDAKKAAAAPKAAPAAKTAPAAKPAATAAAAPAGPKSNVTVPKQTQGATFGEKHAEKPASGDSKIVSPRDPASGLPTGKIAIDESGVHKTKQNPAAKPHASGDPHVEQKDIKAPRDTASGQASGKKVLKDEYGIEPAAKTKKPIKGIVMDTSGMREKMQDPHSGKPTGKIAIDESGAPKVKTKPKGK